MKTNILICPTCEIVGRKEILGEVSEDGSFSIKRFTDHFTKIVSTEFEVMCSVCDTVVYKTINTHGTIEL